MDHKIYLTGDLIKSYLEPRRDDAHKRTYGHVLLVCGSKGMIGAAILAVGGALRSGCGLVSAHIPESERIALMSRYPSALLSLDPHECFSEMPAGPEKYSVIGIGCGLGTHGNTKNVYAELLEWGHDMAIPFVIDADGLNLLAQNPSLLKLVPPGSVMTPHDGELQRLTGPWADRADKESKIKNLARQTGAVIVSKGPNTLVCGPDGEMYINTSGNSGMAKGGSGDVLTGLITGLAGRGYNPMKAACIGVYIHGCAGDLARQNLSAEAMHSADILDFLPPAWKLLE